MKFPAPSGPIRVWEASRHSNRMSKTSKFSELKNAWYFQRYSHCCDSHCLVMANILTMEEKQHIWHRLQYCAWFQCIGPKLGPILWRVNEDEQLFSRFLIFSVLIWGSFSSSNKLISVLNGVLGTHFLDPDRVHISAMFILGPKIHNFFTNL